MSYSIERVANTEVTMGEGPHWDVKTQSLYFINLRGTTIHRYKPATNEHTQATISGSATFIIPIKNTANKFVIGLKRDLVAVTWDGLSDTISSWEKLAKVDTAEGLRMNRMNDAKVDATGKLWAGTMTSESHPLDNNFPRRGNLFSFNHRKEVEYHLNDIQISNGLAWSADSQKFYFIDSMKRTIDQYDYDVANGSISNLKTIFTLDKHNIDGLPDGQTIDTDGNLWVALFNGSRVIKIDPRKPETLLLSIEMPAQQVTSVAFGGKDLDVLYVTTGRHPPDADGPITPADGGLYKITGLGVKGYGGIPFTLSC